MRFYQYVPFLQAEGIELTISPLLSDDYIKRLYAKQATSWLKITRDYFMRTVRLLCAKKFDLLWIEKELFPNLPAWFEQALYALNIPYVADYDDAVFHNYDQNRKSVKFFLNDKIDRVMRGSVLVVCGNTYLAERARAAGASHVEIIPTVVDLERYNVMNLEMRGPLVVGWVGSPSTVKYLDVVVPALKTLAAEIPLQLRVIGAQLSSPGLDVNCRSWLEESEVSEIQGFDVGIMPLVDSPWEKGKCGYKLIQYMACGKPVVASPVGVNQEIVMNRANGYLALTNEDWVSALRILSTNKQSRLDMGALGRRSVEEKYCLQVTAPRLAQLIREVVSRRVF